MAHSFNPSSWETEADKSLEFEARLVTEQVQDTHSYIEKPCPEKSTKQQKQATYWVRHGGVPIFLVLKRQVEKQKYEVNLSHIGFFKTKEKMTKKAG